MIFLLSNKRKKTQQCSKIRVLRSKFICQDIFKAHTKLIKFRAKIEDLKSQIIKVFLRSCFS